MSPPRWAPPSPGRRALPAECASVMQRARDPLSRCRAIENSILIRQHATSGLSAIAYQWSQFYVTYRRGKWSLYHTTNHFILSLVCETLTRVTAILPLRSKIRSQDSKINVTYIKQRQLNSMETKTSYILTLHSWCYICVVNRLLATAYFYILISRLFNLVTCKIFRFFVNHETKTFILKFLSPS